MKVSMRWKLMGAFLLVVLLTGGALYGYLTPTLEHYLVSQTREGLLGEARLARMTAGKEIRELRKDAPGLAATISRETGARVTIISLQGEVMGDSDVKPGDLKDLENHRSRAEVQEALHSGQGSAIRYSATLRTPMLYVAYPFKSAGEEDGVIRLALPLAVLGNMQKDLHAMLGASLLLATLVSLILSYILANVTSRSLRTIAAGASLIGKGEFGQRIPVRSHDEMGELAKVMNDMAARIEDQLASISAERNRLGTILRGMGEGVMVANAAGVITLVNPAFLALFSLREEEVTGRPLIDISRHPVLHDAFRIVVETRNARFEEIDLTLHDEKIVLTHWVPLLEGEEIQGVVAVFHDISDLKRLEKVRRDFVANVSHELRTPATVIKGYAETLLGDLLRTDPDRATRFIEIIDNHAGRLANLIGDLLSLSELESGSLALEMRPQAIDGTVRHVCTLLEEKARAKSINIDLTGISGAPQVLADQGRIEQVLINLLDNAIKYTPERGTIAVAARDAGNMVAISITDSGIGIPPKDLPRIFERFYRVDAARSRDQGGTGLGLSIVKHIVQLHGGNVAVESVPGKGSTFSFTLKKA